MHFHATRGKLENALGHGSSSLRIWGDRGRNTHEDDQLTFISAVSPPSVCLAFISTSAFSKRATIFSYPYNKKYNYHRYKRTIGIREL
jgi:hypothetical protein